MQEDLKWLEICHLASAIKYASRDTIARSTSPRASLTVIEERLFDDFSIIGITESKDTIVNNCKAPIVLDVLSGPMQAANASNLIFAPHTGARLYAIVIENEDQAASNIQFASLQVQFQSQCMDVKIVHPVHSSDKSHQHYFSLVELMYEARTPGTKWTILIDDDTFFPSLPAIQRMLSKYDSSEPQHIGALSQDWHSVELYGLMSFSGAGYMLSVLLAKIISDHNDECIDNSRTPFGDGIVMDCIYDHSTTPPQN